MPTVLTTEGMRVLEYLIRVAPNVDLNDLNTFPTYLGAHEALGLEMIGGTWGESLDRQGLGSLAEWTLENGFPAITGFIIDKTEKRPGKGFFKLYGKNPDIDATWWLSEVRKSKAFPWSEVLRSNSDRLSANNQSDEKRITFSLRKNARTVREVTSEHSRFFLKSEWGPISPYWPALSFSKRSVGDFLRREYNPASDFIVYVGTSNPTRTKEAQFRKRLLSVLVAEPREPIPTDRLVPWESWQEQLTEHGKLWPFSFAIEWVDLPNRIVVQKVSAKEDRQREIIANGPLNAALTRMHDLIKGRIANGRVVSRELPARTLPAGTNLILVLDAKLRDQNNLCALCGQLIPLDTTKKLLQCSPDRIDSKNPSYGEDNLQITHLACNLAKNDGSSEDFEEWLQLVAGDHSDSE